MRLETRPKFWLCLALGLALAGSPVWAQDEAIENEPENEPERSYRLFADLTGWVAQPAGLEYTPATRLDPSDPFNTRILRPGSSTEDSRRWRVGYKLPGNHGNLALTYFSHRDERSLGGVSPGNFIFGETLAYPLFAGFAFDGLADAFQADMTTVLRDGRLDYFRPILETDSVSANWFIGWRRVWHSRDQFATYSALIPDLPPLIPPLSIPRPDLAPNPDTARLRSEFVGRGPETGIEFRFPLLDRKLEFEAGAAIAVLRGEIDSSYRATNSLYLLDGLILGPPYVEFSQLVEVPPVGSGVFVPLADDITQVEARFGLRGEDLSTTSEVLDLHLGFRWKAHSRVDVIGGFRSTRYTDVGVDLLPHATTINPTEVGFLYNLNLQDVTQVSRSATYEGFYLGVTLYAF